MVILDTRRMWSEIFFMNQVFVISGGWWLPGQRMEPGDSVALEMTNVRTAADRMLAREIRLHALIRRNRSMDFADGGFQPYNTIIQPKILSTSFISKWFKLMAFRFFYFATNEWHPINLVWMMMQCQLSKSRQRRDKMWLWWKPGLRSSGLEQIKKYELRPERKCPIAQIISRSFRNYIEICWKASSHAFWSGARGRGPGWGQPDKNSWQRTKFEMLWTLETQVWGGEGFVSWKLRR